MTPLMEGGTLQTLAKSISRSQQEDGSSTQALDVRFRPRFDELLVALQNLHSRGLCHDDVKPDNVFVAGSSAEVDGSWLLGDLGNVRHISHPYHVSRVWTHGNKQLPDCRANDALRAIKTYLQFLRRASKSSAKSSLDFDTAVFEAREPWARLLWRADGTGTALGVESLLQWSAEEEHPSSLESLMPVTGPRNLGRFQSWLLRPFLSKRAAYGRATESALKISASEGLSRVLGLTRILGVPVGRC